MSRIIFLGTPAYGHINPTLPVVQELVERGERVTYYNNEDFRPVIERTGASFTAYPPSEMGAKELAAALQDGDLSNVASLILGATEQLLPFLLNALPQEQPDLVIFDSMALWGRMAATQLNLRAASSICHLIFDTSHFMSGGKHSVRYLGNLLPKLPRLLPARSRLKRRYQDAFPTEQPLMPVRGGLNIMYTSRILQPESTTIDETFRFVGPSINPQTRSEAFTFERNGANPAVYISLGTLHHRQTEFYRRCFTAFSDYPAQFILSAGMDTDLQALGEIPANFFVRPTVPQLEVLQQVDVFITHAGMNSVHEGLYFGVPLILLPHQLEQLLNARCVVKQGAGIVIESQMGRGQATADELRGALDTILADTRYRDAAAQLQQTLRLTGGFRQAADEIQAYLRQPPDAL